MDLKELMSCTSLYFDSSLKLKGMEKKGTKYVILKGKLHKRSLINVPRFTLNIFEDRSAEVIVNLEKSDFFNTFNFLPQYDALNYVFENLMSKSFCIIAVDDLLSAVIQKTVSFSKCKEPIETSFSDPELVSKMEKDRSLGDALIGDIEAYISFTMFDNIANFKLP